MLNSHFLQHILLSYLLFTFVAFKMDEIDKESAKLLKVDELKAALKARGCSTAGKKADLYDRLVAFLESPPEAEALSEAPSQERSVIEVQEGVLYLLVEQL